MKKHIRKHTLAMCLQLLFINYSFSQLDSIFNQGVYRTFILHLPTGYTASNQYPIVVNLHGDNSSAAQQESYSQFDNVADTKNFIVVYPNGISGSWTINGLSDVTFISNLIDTIRTNYSCNACLFATGMSDGGFMTYKLACALPQHLTAIAVVAGNMTKNLENTCVIANGLPVMHFHGTADPIVHYTGAVGIPAVDTTIKWWVNQNNCNTTPLFNSLPNINVADSCTAENYFYSGGVNGSAVSFYKIINGGHTWPGAVAAPPLGFTNEDINASDLIGDFFQQYCSGSVGIKENEPLKQITISPNPFNHITTISFSEEQKNTSVKIINLLGKEVMTLYCVNSNQLVIEKGEMAAGIYFVQTIDEKKNIVNSKVVVE